MQTNWSPSYDLTPFASTDAARPALNALHLAPSGITATNGKVAVRVPWRDDAPESPVSISTGSLKPALRAIGRSTITLTVDPDSASLSTPTATLAFPAVDASDASQVSSVLDKYFREPRPEHTITLSAQQLKLIADWAAKHGQKLSTSSVVKEPCTPITLAFDKPDEPCRLSVPLDGDRRADIVLMPINHV